MKNGKHIVKTHQNDFCFVSKSVYANLRYCPTIFQENFAKAMLYLT